MALPEHDGTATRAYSSRHERFPLTWQEQATVDSNDEGTRKRHDFDELLSEMMVGGAGGLATSDPVATAFGAGAPLLTRGLAWAAAEFRQRVLGQREAYRVVTVVREAKAKYDKNISEGKQLRTDDFFLKDEAAGRTSADEIIEGTLLAAQREHEERKIPYYANFIAGLPFVPGIDRYTANLLLRTAQELSYRQLCLLALVAKKDQHILPNTSRPADSIGYEEWSVKEELDDLGYAKRELVLPAHKGLGFRTNIGVPADLELKAGGVALYALMELTEIPDSKLYKLSSLLRDWAGMSNVGD